MTDLLTRFSFPGMPIRGGIVQLGDAWRELLELQELRDAEAALLGQAVAAAPLLASNIKFDGLLSLQLTGGECVGMLLAEAHARGTVRGLITSNEGTEITDFPTAVKGATMAVMIEPQGGQRSQGIVGLDGTCLSSCLEGYFRQSEQIPTRIWLHADRHIAAGIMLQRMPGELADDDAWNRLGLMTETLTSSEVLQLSAVEILRRIYAEDDVQVGGQKELQFACTCNREKVAEMLRSLGEAELEDHPEGSQLEIRCGFCNRAYAFDAVDLAAALHDAAPNHPTRQ